MEEEKKDVQETKQEETVNTTETVKTEGKNTKTIVIAVVAVLVIAAIVAAVFLFTGKNGGGDPKEVAKKYVEAMNEGSSDKILDITDVKGAIAWKTCGADIEKFEEALNNVKDVDLTPYKDEIKNALDQAMSMLKAFGGVTIELSNIEEPQDQGKGVSTVTATIKIKVLGQEQEQKLNLATFNGKYIGEVSE